MAREHTEQLKHDPLMDQYLKTSAWVQPRRKTILLALGAIGAVIALFFLYQWYAQRSAESAGNAFLEALKTDGAIVSDPLPPSLPPGQKAFKSEDEKNRAVVEAYEKVARDYPQYREVASYYAAVRQLKVDAVKGEAALKQLVDKNSLVSAQARLTLAERYEAAGKLNEAAAEYQKLKAAPSDVPLDLIELYLGRVSEAQGKTQEASDLYFNVASHNREKPTAVNTEALTKLTLLDPARVDKLPEVKKDDPFAGARTIIK